MKKLMLLAFAAMTILSATTIAPPAPKSDPIPECWPCPVAPNTGN